MEWLGYIAIIVVVIAVLRSTSKRGRAKRLAKKLVANYHMHKNQNPNLDEAGLYKKVVQSAPLRYSDDRFLEIVKFARQLSEQRDGVLDAQVNLMWLIAAVCIVEIGGSGGQVSGYHATRMYHVAFMAVPREMRG